ncbi:MAG: hypothetical protein ACFFAO_21455 [Candidatus Hermodarchaeota archaeon]
MNTPTTFTLYAEQVYKNSISRVSGFKKYNKTFYIAEQINMKPPTFLCQNIENRGEINILRQTIAKLK